jgi:GntR family negative regulator for fad regulon and positive regulator of fabA
MDSLNGLKPAKPIQHAEHQILTAILRGDFPPGSPLPNERSLAEKVGVTRPTLRETLHRLAREGWITIHHGKPTLVNDFWNSGGLGLLSTLAKYGEFMPPDFIAHLLDFRVVLLPPVAGLAAKINPAALTAHLQKAADLGGDTQIFADYDWELQNLMARLSGNIIYPMIFNDFAMLFKTMALICFSTREGRESSLAYYNNLAAAIPLGTQEVEGVVRGVMEESARLWAAMKPA